MLLPAQMQQLTIYLGWLLHRVRGGVVAGILFVLPGATVLALSMIYVTYQNAAVLESVFVGVRPLFWQLCCLRSTGWGEGCCIDRSARHCGGCVCVQFHPVRALSDGNRAGGSCGIIFRIRPDQDDPPGPMTTRTLILSMPRHPHRMTRPRGVSLRFWQYVARSGWCRSSRFTPCLVAGTSMRSKACFQPDGGCDVWWCLCGAVYMAEQTVNHYGWLTGGEMLDGLGLAETTPGPLIMVTQFVGFIGAYRNPGALDPMLAGTLGALVASWVTFAPASLDFPRCALY